VTQTAASYEGIITDRRALRRNRWISGVSIGIPLAGSIWGFARWGEVAPTGITAAVFVPFFLSTGIAMGLGLHRYFSHRAFKAGPVLRFALAMLGSWTMQGPIDRWVADHRRHHRFTDRALDPHSPLFDEDRPIHSRLRGWLHSHVLWTLTGSVTDTARYAGEIVTDPITSWFSRTYWLWSAISLGLPALIGAALGGSAEALRCFVWAGCFRVALIHNLTWAVNSFGHMYGSKVDGSTDESRDNLLLTLLLFGEGLHSYHHRHPSAAVNEPRALDLNGRLISAAEKLGWVWDVRRFASEPAGAEPARPARADSANSTPERRRSAG
jgi:stearoyl-CoA desaturase (delta-9 desaturase)